MSEKILGVVLYKYVLCPHKENMGSSELKIEENLSLLKIDSIDKANPKSFTINSYFIVLILINVNFVFTFVQPENQTVDQVVPNKINDESEVRENLHNLFKSITKNDTKKREIYHGILKQEVAREQHVFDAMKEQLRVTQNRNAYKRRNFYKSVNIGESVVAIKRETNENKNGTDEPLKDRPPDFGQPSQASIADLQSKLFQKIADRNPASSHKITVVGSGAVGMACAYSLLNQGVTSDLCLIDIDDDRVQGELMDLQHGSAFLNSAKIKAGSDYKLSENSKIIVISAGVRQKEGESRLSLLARNLNVLKSMIPTLASLSPNAVLLIVSNPVDILTYMAWKLSGFPQNRVIGAGTNLDTSRFRFLVSEKLRVAPESVHGWIIGEHGDSSVAVWSNVNVAGVNLRDLNPNIATENDPDNWKSIHEKVVTSAYEIIKLKGYTSWAIGASVSNLCSTILSNNAKVHAVSVYVKGLYEIQDESYLSLPCALGENGVISVVKQNLNEQELDQLRHSAKIMGDAIRELNIPSQRK